MIESKIETVKYENGEIQRYQIVCGFAWKDLCFAQGQFTRESFSELLRMYRIFIATKNPTFYGALVTFHIPDDIQSPFTSQTEFGQVFDRQLAAAIGLRRMVAEGSIRKKGHSLQIDAPEIRQFIERLEQEGWIGVAYGEKEDEVSIMPVGSDLGYLSSIEPRPQIVCNSHFFTMDLFDCDSPYDIFGTPYGMIIKDGIMSQPPLNHREALMVDMNGIPRITRPEVKDHEISIQGKTFFHGRNCTIYQRPEVRQTPREAGLDVMIIAEFLSERTDFGEECSLIDLPEVLLSEQGGNGLHLGRNRGIVGSQIRMVAAGRGNDEVVAVVSEVHCNGGDYRCGRVFEIYSHHAAVCTGDLVHQAAGFPEVDVLGLLSHDGKLSGGEAVVVIERQTVLGFHYYLCFSRIFNETITKKQKKLAFLLIKRNSGRLKVIGLKFQRLNKTQKPVLSHWFSCSRGERTRTFDILLPKQAP